MQLIFNLFLPTTQVPFFLLLLCLLFISMWLICHYFCYCLCFCYFPNCCYFHLLCPLNHYHSFLMANQELELTDKGFHGQDFFPDLLWTLNQSHCFQMKSKLWRWYFGRLANSPWMIVLQFVAFTCLNYSGLRHTPVGVIINNYMTFVGEHNQVLYYSMVFDHICLAMMFSHFSNQCCW